VTSEGGEETGGPELGGQEIQEIIVQAENGERGRVLTLNK